MGNVVWTILGEDKHLSWAVIIALLLAVIVSYFTMLPTITLLLAVAWVVMLVVTFRKAEQPESSDEKEARNS
jgi:membrane protein implicated in regulation of membrane protease activity